MNHPLLGVVGSTELAFFDYRNIKEEIGLVICSIILLHDYKIRSTVFWREGQCFMFQQLLVF